MKNTIPKFIAVSFIGFSLLFSYTHAQNTVTGVYPINWINVSAFNYSDYSNAAQRAISQTVPRNGGVINFSEWNTARNTQQLFNFIGTEFANQAPGSMVILNYTGHGSTQAISAFNLDRATYLRQVYNEAVKNDLHAVVLMGDCYGNKICSNVPAEYLEDGRITIFTGAPPQGGTADAADSEWYYNKIVANSSAIDANKDGKVTYGEWEKWAQENEKGYIPGHLGNPDAVIYNRADVSPYEIQYCIHVKPGQDEGDGFGPMFGNEDVYDPDTQLNILGETIAQITAKGLTPKQEGTDNREGNYAARKNQMGHLRDNFPKHEKLTHQGDEDEMDAGKGPSSNYQTARDLAMQGKENKEVKIFWSSGGYNKPLTAQQLMDSARSGDHAYKAHSSEIAVKPSNSYSIGKPFAVDIAKATEKDVWAVAKPDGEEGCKFKKLTDEEKRQMFAPPSANFPGGNGGGNGGGGGGGGNEMSQLLDALKNMFGQGQGQGQQQPQPQASPAPADPGRTCPTNAYPACTKEGTTVCVPQTTDWRDLPNIEYDTVCTTEKSPTTAIDFQAMLNPEQQVQDLANIVGQLANSGIPQSMLDGVISVLIGLIKNLFEGAAFPVTPISI